MAEVQMAAFVMKRSKFVDRKRSAQQRTEGSGHGHLASYKSSPKRKIWFKNYTGMQHLTY
jgi:hypothetical protein